MMVVKCLIVRTCPCVCINRKKKVSSYYKNRKSTRVYTSGVMSSCFPFFYVSVAEKKRYKEKKGKEKKYQQVSPRRQLVFSFKPLLHLQLLQESTVITSKDRKEVCATLEGKPNKKNGSERGETRILGTARRKKRGSSL